MIKCCLEESQKAVNQVGQPSQVRADYLRNYVAKNPAAKDKAIAEFDRRRPVELLPGLMTWLAAPEDIIIAKLRYFREGESDKHLRDIRGILAHSTCDLDYLEAWITRLGLTEQWRLTFGSHVP